MTAKNKEFFLNRGKVTRHSPVRLVFFGPEKVCIELFTLSSKERPNSMTGHNVFVENYNFQRERG